MLTSDLEFIGGVLVALSQIKGKANAEVVLRKHLDTWSVDKISETLEAICKEVDDRTKPKYPDLPPEYNLMPSYTRDQIDAYVEEHYPIGHFLYALLICDLDGVMAHGDTENLKGLQATFKYLCNRCPRGCWKTQEAVDAWLSQHE
jgi:hypothetical protein